MATVSEPGSARDNESWVRAFADDGVLGDGARAELRAVLVRGLRRVLSSRGVAPDLCEDFAQDALIRVRARLGSFRGESRFTTWALSIATRIAFDELRHQRWKDVSFEAASEAAALPVRFDPQTDATPEKALVRENVLAALREVLENKITARQRAVLVAELGGMPQAEIAASLGMNRNALYKLSHDARKRVKAHLETAGIREIDVLEMFE